MENNAFPPVYPEINRLASDVVFRLGCIGSGRCPLDNEHAITAMKRMIEFLEDLDKESRKNEQKT